MTITGVYVLDATVLIDICHGGIARETISLLERTIAPDLVCGEVEDSSIGDLVALGLAQREYTAEEILSLQREVIRFPGLTHKDVSALLLALDEGAVLLTGDDCLKQHATKQGLDVHWILWILDMLVDLQFLDRLSAADALERILGNGSWLPIAEYTKRIRKWREQSEQAYP